MKFALSWLPPPVWFHNSICCPNSCHMKTIKAPNNNFNFYIYFSINTMWKSSFLLYSRFSLLLSSIFTVDMILIRVGKRVGSWYWLSHSVSSSMHNWDSFQCISCFIIDEISRSLPICCNKILFLLLNNMHDNMNIWIPSNYSLYCICCATYWVTFIFNSVLSPCGNINTCLIFFGYICSCYCFQKRFQECQSNF